MCLPARVKRLTRAVCVGRLCVQGTNASPEKLARWRAVELKHGRIAMLASTGYIVQECLRWPGYLSPSAGVKFSEIPNGIKGLAAIPPAGLAQIFIGIALMEVATWRYYEGPWPGSVPAGKLPGDVAGELWVRYSDPEVKKTKLNIELNNGRAAMLGSLGMIMHDHLTGSCARCPASTDTGSPPLVLCHAPPPPTRLVGSPVRCIDLSSDERVLALVFRAGIPPGL